MFSRIALRHNATSMIYRFNTRSKATLTRSHTFMDNSCESSNNLYGVLPDGRVSLGRKMFGNMNIKKNFSSNWLNDPSTYPILAVMVGAITLLIGCSANTLLYEPSVYINKQHRGVSLYIH